LDHNGPKISSGVEVVLNKDRTKSDRQKWISNGDETLSNKAANTLALDG
jgi:hypothetical protein